MASNETAESAKPKPLRRDARRNRERILAAAREVFAEDGLGATLDGVAERAGVGVGTVYRRYRNKDALLDELFEERIAEVRALAEAQLARPEPWQALVDFLEQIQEMFAADRALHDVVVRSGAGQERIAHAKEQLLAPIAQLVDRAKRAGQLRSDFDVTDISIINAMLGAVMQETHETSPELWRRYFAIIIDGLARTRSHTTETTVPALTPSEAELVLTIPRHRRPA